MKNPKVLTLAGAKKLCDEITATFFEMVNNVFEENEMFAADDKNI